MSHKFQEGQWVMNGNQVGWVDSVLNNYVQVKYPGVNYTSNLSPDNLISFDDISPEAKEAAKTVLVDVALATNDKVLFEYAIGKRSDYASCVECKLLPAIYCDKSFCEDCYKNFLNG